MYSETKSAQMLKAIVNSPWIIKVGDRGSANNHFVSKVVTAERVTTTNSYRFFVDLIADPNSWHVLEFCALYESCLQVITMNPVSPEEMASVWASNYIDPYYWMPCTSTRILKKAKAFDASLHMCGPTTLSLDVPAQNPEAILTFLSELTHLEFSIEVGSVDEFGSRNVQFTYPDDHKDVLQFIEDNDIP
jgi:hypothetical protein